MQRGIVGGLHQQVDMVEMHGIFEIDMLVSRFVLQVPSLQVENFPAIVTRDAHGNSLHKEVFAASQAELAKYV